MLEETRDYPEDKAHLYSLLQKDLLALVEGVREPIPNLANASALLWQGLQNINWAGFYLVDGDRSGSWTFQGKPACIYIPPAGKGVCGTAVQKIGR